MGRSGHLARLVASQLGVVRGGPSRAGALMVWLSPILKNLTQRYTSGCSSVRFAMIAPVSSGAIGWYHKLHTLRGQAVAIGLKLSCTSGWPPRF